jgi:hypothetical protein
MMLQSLLLCVGLVAAAPDDGPTVRLNVVETSVDRMEATVSVVDVQNLDTYSFDVVYDTNVVEVKSAGISSQRAKNALDNGRRQILPVISKQSGVVHISAAVTGNEPTGRIEEGVLGVVVFERISSQSPAVRLENVEMLDNARKPIDIGDGGDGQ